MSDGVKKSGLSQALRYLERKDYTVTELKQKLLRKEYSEQEIEAVIVKLSELRFLDDSRYAESYIRCHYENYSSRMLSMKLQQKGILKDLFLSAYDKVCEEFGVEPEQEALKNAVEAALRKVKRQGQTWATLPDKEKERIVGALYRKGFTIHQIRKVLDVHITDYEE